MININNLKKDDNFFDANGNKSKVLMINELASFPYMLVDYQGKIIRVFKNDDNLIFYYRKNNKR